MTTAEGLLQAGTFAHDALFYQGRDEYAREVCSFVRQGVSAGEPVLVAVPGRRLDLVRGALGEAGQAVSFADMAVLGRNPARIIPAIRAFMDRYPGRRIRCVGEPVWADRSAAELREATRYEALVNTAFGGSPATMVCLYDTAELTSSVLDDAGCTHPAVLRPGSAAEPSPGYLGPEGLPPSCDRPLSCPPATAERLTYQKDLRPVRSLVTRCARRARLPGRRITDLVLAASEVAANTLRHTRAGGTVHLWHDEREILCQIHDSGVIADPLAGYRVPADDLPGGQGLWLVNQVCDLVELRSSPDGTTICLHMSLR